MDEVTPKDRKWVWFSSKDSVRDRKLSVFACFETLAMVAIYWAIAWTWDTHIHLLAGLVTMPLMLFRSDESVELGLKWGAMVRGVDLETSVAFPIHVFVTIACLLSSFFVAGAIFTGLLIVLFCTVKIDGRKKTTRNVVTQLFEGISYSVLTCGVWLFAPILIRFFASLRHMLQGFNFISENFVRLTSRTDTAHPIEPIPDPFGYLNVFSSKRFLEVVRDEVNSSGIVEATLLSLIAVAVFGPSLLITVFFRWAIKSAAWFYAPLLFVTARYDGNNRLIWMRSFSRLAVTRLRVVLSLIAIGVAVSALVVDWPTALAALQFGQDMELPVVPLSLLLILDWNALYTWQYASLATATLTLVLYFRLDQMAKQDAVGARFDEFGWALRSMVWTDRLRSAFALIWLALITPPTLFFFHCAGKLPDWAARPLGWLFETDACFPSL